MPRRRPADVRAGASARYPRPGVRVIVGLSRGTLADIAVAEPWCGAAVTAFEKWRAAVHGPTRGIRPREDDCGIPECCGSHLLARDNLAAVLGALPRRSARELRALLAPLDQRFVARSLADPTTPADWPWWHRRIVP